MITGFKAAIFDIDGTLVDSMQVWERALQDFLDKHHLVREPAFVSQLGVLSFEESSALCAHVYALPLSTEEIRAEWNALAAAQYRNQVKAKPGALAYVQRLKAQGVGLAIATALAPDLLRICLQAQQMLQYFDVCVSLSEVSTGKSAPDVYLKAAQQLNVPPQDCVVFEDFLPGIRSAKQAGMRVVGVLDSFSRADWGDIRQTADATIFDFTRLL